MQFDVMNIPGMILDTVKAAPDDPEINYRYSSDPTKCCGVCEHFIIPGACELVAGVKRAVDVCDLFSPDPMGGMIYAQLPEPVLLPPTRDLPIGPAQTEIGPIQAILVPSPVQSELVSNAPQVQAEVVTSEGGPGSGPRPGQSRENPRQVDKDFATGRNDIRTPFPNAAQRPPVGIFKKPSPRIAGPSVAGPRPVSTNIIRQTSEADRPKSFDLPPAREEMKTKSDVDIEVETAYKWGARSVACYEMFKETDDTKWLLKAEDYRHETLEHAALAKDGGKTLGAIEKMLDDAKGSTPEIESVN